MNIDYNQLTDRNIGLLTESDQQLLKESHVAVFGVGGLGGVIAEVLVRAGIGTLTLVDRDVFEASNLNRQIFAFEDSLGRKKTEVAASFLHRINPGLKTHSYPTVDDSNIEILMRDVGLALLALDDIVPCIVISRYAKRQNIPLVEGWAIPFANVRVFTSETPSLEEVYQMPTLHKDVSTISEEDRKSLNLKMLFHLQSIEGIGEYYPEAALSRIREGKITSFAPMVWLTAVLMATEALKIILHKGEPALSPAFHLYDPYRNRIPKQ
jgi:molybdopterin/thiamine biosynthesis adenylyltransferase